MTNTKYYGIHISIVPLLSSATRLLDFCCTTEFAGSTVTGPAGLRLHSTPIHIISCLGAGILGYFLIPALSFCHQLGPLSPLPSSAGCLAFKSLYPGGNHFPSLWLRAGCYGPLLPVFWPCLLSPVNLTNPCGNFCPGSFLSSGFPK